jgi:hypothetical protein
MAIRVSALFLLATIPVLGLYAQQYGEIRGTITDVSGAVVPEVSVTFTNAATQQVRVATSNDTGLYAAPNMLPGVYSVRVEKTGFKVTTQTAMEVQVGDVIGADFVLQLGEMTQSVEVSGTAELLNTQSSAMGSVVESKQITDLPLNGRDYLSLVALSSNASAESAPLAAGGLQGGVRANTNISVSGQRLEYNHYTLDGAENTDPNFNSYVIHPSVDAVQEFKVQTGIYSAEFGRGASQINVNTVPGTNQYHGAAFEFLRNSYMDAQQWSAVGPKNPFRRNNYGFVLNGPVSIPKVFNGKNRLFFMSNFEALRDNTTIQNKSSVAPDAMRAGNFSLTPGVQIIYDPKTRVYPASGTPSASPFPGNIIPESRIVTPSLNLMKYYPQQTVPGFNTTLLNNYIFSSATLTQSTQFNQRVDFTQNQASTWFGRFSWGDDYLLTGGTFPTNGSYVPTIVRQAVIANTRILSSSIVNDVRFGWNQFNNDLTGYYGNTKQNVGATLGIQGLVAPAPSAWGLPSWGGNFAYPSSPNPWVLRDDTFQLVEGLSLLRGNHSIKVGGEVRRMRYNNYGNQFTNGQLGFDGGSTCNPANCTSASGYAFADALLGLVSTAYRAVDMADAMMRSTFAAGYIQDDWKVSRKLTLNLGLRYENIRPWVDKYNSMISAQVTSWGVGFKPGNNFGAYLLPNDAALTPILTRPGNQPFYQGLNEEFGNQPVQNGNQMGPGLINPDNHNFGPRIGLAYSPGERWSVRAGFGVFYVQDIGNTLFDMARNRGGKDVVQPPNNARTVQEASPWAGENNNPQCPGYVGACLLAPQLNVAYQGNRTPYVEQYMLVLQRQLTKHLVVEGGYLGSQGHHLARYVVLNQAVFPTGPTDNSSTASRRPWPNLGNIQETMGTVSSSYNSGEGKLTQRYNSGLVFSVAFTWSKAIDTGSTSRGGSLWPYNSYNLAQLRGPSDFDVPLRFVANVVYDLPVGPGKALLNHGVAGAVVGGWQVAGILTANSGLPLNGPSIGDTAKIGALGNTCDYTGISPVPLHRDTQHWWNAAAFNCTDPTLTYQVGNEGRNALYGIGAWTVNTSLSRNFQIHENHRLNMRLDAFNALNKANYITPSTTYTNPSIFGIITAAGTMRQLQVSLKYSF